MSGKQRILALLRDGRPHTHHELYALGCIAHSRVAELRKDGYTIECWRDGDDSVYQLVGTLDGNRSSSPEPAAASGLFPSSAPDMAAAAEDGALELHPDQLSLGVAA